MEGKLKRGRSPPNKRIKIEPRSDQVIKELQIEEDNVSVHSRRDKELGHVGISVNERLNGTDVDCDGQPLII